MNFCEDLKSLKNENCVFVQRGIRLRGIKLLIGPFNFYIIIQLALLVYIVRSTHENSPDIRYTIHMLGKTTIHPHNNPHPTNATIEQQRGSESSSRRYATTSTRSCDADPSFPLMGTSFDDTQLVSARSPVHDAVAGTVAPPGQTEVETLRLFSAPLGT